MLRETADAYILFYNSFEELEKKVTNLLRDNEIELLDPVFGNTVEQKSKIRQLVSQK